MNEYQRQSYLTSMGIENYMPRWRLALAPLPVACELPAASAIPSVVVDEEVHSSSQTDTSSRERSSGLDKPVMVADVLRDLTLDQSKKNASVKLEPESIKPSAPPLNVKTIPAFSLSIWRPQNDVLVIDSRNTQLALPTELLLQNIFRALYGAHSHPGVEDVLRWPLIDNTFVSRTVDDARSVLQVWLEVELERRPVKQLLLMGQNAAQYFLDAEDSYDALLFHSIDLPRFSSRALIAPSLVELLQKPEQKPKLWRALQSWDRAA